MSSSLSSSPPVIFSGLRPWIELGDPRSGAAGSGSELPHHRPCPSLDLVVFITADSPRSSSNHLLHQIQRSTPATSLLTWRRSARLVLLASHGSVVTGRHPQLQADVVVQGQRRRRRPPALSLTSSPWLQGFPGRRSLPPLASQATARHRELLSLQRSSAAMA